MDNLSINNKLYFGGDIYEEKRRYFSCYSGGYRYYCLWYMDNQRAVNA